MKTMKSSIAVIFLGIIFTSCTENLNRFNNDSGILPERFKIDIPNSMSNMQAANQKSAEADTLQGNEIYAHLNTFIAVGESAADIVEDIILAIGLYDLDEPKSLSYRGDDDNRVKNLEVIENAEYDNRTWTYGLTVTDANSESEPDGGMAMQVFWNNNPIEGIALLKPYNIDRKHDRNWLDAVFSIEYSEIGTSEYEAYMIVEIADMPMPDPRLDPFALNSLKMFVGKNGDAIDVYGNSDHPNAKFFTDRKGFSWSFVASAYDSKDVAIAELGLPPSGLDESNRTVLLKDYSVKNVLTEEVNTFFVETFGFGPDSTDLAGYLRNADAPAYFADHGFVQGGSAPGAEYDGLVERVNQLSPYNPKAINELEIIFNR